VWKVEGFFFVYLGETVFEYHFLKLSPKPAPTAWISGKKKKTHLQVEAMNEESI